LVVVVGGGGEKEARVCGATGAERGRVPRRDWLEGALSGAHLPSQFNLDSSIITSTLEEDEI
jgi:hypothetical protein